MTTIMWTCHSFRPVPFPSLTESSSIQTFSTHSILMRSLHFVQNAIFICGNSIRTYYTTLTPWIQSISDYVICMFLLSSTAPVAHTQCRTHRVPIVRKVCICGEYMKYSIALNRFNETIRVWAAVASFHSHVKSDERKTFTFNCVVFVVQSGNDRFRLAQN